MRKIVLRVLVLLAIYLVLSSLTPATYAAATPQTQPGPYQPTGQA